MRVGIVVVVGLCHGRRAATATASRAAAPTLARVHAVERELIVVERHRRDHRVHVGCVDELVAFELIVAAVDVILTQIVERLAEARLAVVDVKYVLFGQFATHSLLVEHKLA